VGAEATIELAKPRDFHNRTECDASLTDIDPILRQRECARWSLGGPAGACKFHGRLSFRGSVIVTRLRRWRTSESSDDAARTGSARSIERAQSRSRSCRRDRTMCVEPAGAQQRRHKT
jgi:hypothetical protein